MSTEGSTKVPNGAAVAAFLAVAIGSLVLAIVAFACDLSKPFEQVVFGIGKLWMPGAAHIGPYSGKETLGLAAWLVSWIVLHFVLRKRQLEGGLWLTVFLVGMGIASTLIWPPVARLFG